MNKTVISLCLVSGICLAIPLMAEVHATISNSIVSVPKHAVQDFHSYANPEDVRIRHLDLEWQVLFDQKIFKGIAVLTIERVSQNRQAPLILDTRKPEYRDR